MRGWIVLWLACLTGPAFAADACSESQELDRYRLLRRMSLDLRGHMPSYDEYLALDQQAGVPDSLVDDYLASDAFRVAMRSYHRDLLWPNISTVQLTDIEMRLVDGKQGIMAVLGSSRRKKFRQGSGVETCGDFEQKEFDSNGFPVVEKITDPVSGKQYFQDGWVMVEPYWAPGTSVKVCAFDAQALPTSTGAATCPAGAPKQGPNACAVCDSSNGPGSARCGCGPNLRWCYSEGTDKTILASLEESLLRIVDAAVTGSMPYSSILTEKTTWIDGPIAFWMRHLTRTGTSRKAFNPTVPEDGTLPDDPDFTDPAFQAVARSGIHSGVLTHPAFTLRFQTNRGRANRARVAFAGQYFVPPSGVDTNCNETTDDLTERCTCRQCHMVLEPLAAHFADVAEAGSALMTDRTTFPIYRAECDPAVTAKIPQDCVRYYAIDTVAHKPGTLLPYQYLDADSVFHQLGMDQAVEGPAGMAKDLIETGQFHTAIVASLFHRLMGRELDLDATSAGNDVALHAAVVSDFAATDDFRALVRALVTADQYRRIR